MSTHEYFYPVSRSILFIFLLVSHFGIINILQNNMLLQFKSSAIPIFYHGGQLVTLNTLNSKCNIQSRTTCNGFWSCSNKICQISQNITGYVAFLHNIKENCNADSISLLNPNVKLLYYKLQDTISVLWGISVTYATAIIIQIILSFLVIQQKDKRMVLIPFYVISMLTILSFMLSQIFLIITLVANNEFIYQQRLN